MTSINRFTVRATVVALFTLTLTSSVASAREGWLTDMNQAMATAKEENKDVFVAFMGSDWCHWCKVLDKEVLSQPEFAAVKNDFVLVLLDFPQNSRMTKEQIKHNEAWRSTFQIQGFPSVFITDPSGRPYARTGYREGGAPAYIQHLTKLRGIRKQRDSALAMAKGTQGLERAKHLDSAIKAIEPGIAWLAYMDTIKEITELDANDQAGLRTKYENDRIRRLIGKELDQIMASFQRRSSDAAETAGKLERLAKKVGAQGRTLHDLKSIIAQVHFQGKNFDEAILVADSMLADPQISNELNLVWTVTKSRGLAFQKDFAAALAELDKTTANPAMTAEVAMQLIALRAQILVGDERNADALNALNRFLPSAPEGPMKEQLQTLRDGIKKRIDEGDAAE